MSDVPSSYSTSNSELIQELEELGIYTTWDQLLEKTEEEIKAMLSTVFTDMTPEEANQVLEQIKAAQENEFVLASDCYHELEDILDDREDLTATEKATIERTMEDLEEIMAWCGGATTIADVANEAWGDVLERNIDVEAGTTGTVDTSGAANGDNYIVTCSTDSTSGSALNTEENADWLDLDGDGYNEVDPDTNNDDIADKDFDGVDGITEADMTYGANTTPTTVDLGLEETDTLEIVSYDAEANTTVYKVTREDGLADTDVNGDGVVDENDKNYIVFYITVIDAQRTIVNKIPTNYTSADPALLDSLYENASSVYSIGEILNGEVDGSPDSVEHSSYHVYDMSTLAVVDETTGTTTNVADITLDADTVEDGDTYTINCESGTTDDITIDTDGGTVDLDTNANGDLIITITYNAGTADEKVVTITVIGNEDTDSITINNDDYKDLYSYVDETHGGGL